MKIELLPGGRAPEQMSEGAAGFDVFARKVELFGYQATIALGFKIDTSGGPFGPMAAFLIPRSGWGRKYGFRLRNTIGLIDPDYRGEVIMAAQFDESPPELASYAESECNGCHAGWCVTCSIFKDDNEQREPRVGQIVIMPVYSGELTEVDNLGETKRGSGGFGSTGS